MAAHKTRRVLWTAAALAAGAAVLSMCVGASSIPPAAVLRALLQTVASL